MVHVRVCEVSLPGPPVAFTRKSAIVVEPEYSATVTIDCESEKLGAWLTHTTVIWKVCVAALAPSESVRFTVTVVTPDWYKAGVNESVPFGRSVGCTLKSDGVSTDSVNVTVWVASLGGPGLTLVAQMAEYGPESSRTATAWPAVKEGGWFQNVSEIVMVTEEVELAGGTPVSVAYTVHVVVPNS